MLKKIENIIAIFTDIIGKISAFLLLMLLLNIFYDVMMRYFFKNSSIAMQEMEWHLFSILFLFGISYALKEEAHVRVDIIYDNLSSKKKALINVIGALIFIIPFSIVIINSGFSFAKESFDMSETSSDPGGLGFRFLIKGAITISFLFLIISTIGFILNNISILLDKQIDKQNQ